MMEVIFIIWAIVMNIAVLIALKRTYRLQNFVESRFKSIFDMIANVSKREK